MSWLRFIFTRSFWSDDTTVQIVRIFAALLTLALPWIVYADGPVWFYALWAQALIASVVVTWVLG